MWVHTHKTPVSERSGAALQQLLPVPSFATPPQHPAGPPASSPSGEPSFAPPAVRHPHSAPGPEGTSFLLVDDPPAAGADSDSDSDPAPARGFRDSIASIVNDPFFLRFHDIDREPPPSHPPSAPPSVLPALPAATTTAAHRHDERNPPWIPPRKESLSNRNPTTPWVCTRPCLRSLSSKPSRSPHLPLCRPRLNTIAATTTTTKMRALAAWRAPPPPPPLLLFALQQQ
jgi:hypothetical protein